MSPSDPLLMSGHKPEGRAHRVLRRLAEMPATSDTLRACIDPNKRLGFEAMLASVVNIGLVDVTNDLYRITPLGLQALRILEDGENYGSVGRPSVRVFPRAVSV